MDSLELAGVPGAPETLLPATLLDRLPASAAPAPWRVHARALVWWARPTRAASAMLPAALRGRAQPVVVVGGMVSYDDTPVGAYDEVFGVIGCRVGRSVRGTVAFMAVDSPTSLVGGRSNWSMPKTMARFEGGIASGSTMTARGDTDLDWTVSAGARALGPALPMRSSATVVQEFPDGRLRASRLASRGRARAAVVKVDVHSAASLPEWLVPGRHLGALFPRFDFTLGVPELDRPH